MRMALVVCALLLSSPALAQTASETVSNGEQKLIFRDDPLGALAASPTGDRIYAPIRAHRVTLIRPRTSFVQEMMKSILHL